MILHTSIEKDLENATEFDAQSSIDDEWGPSRSPITEWRLAAARNGYTPTPVYGKNPAPEKWQQKHEVSKGEIESWERDGFYPAALSTGVLTKNTPAIDIDILHEEAATAVEE